LVLVQAVVVARDQLLVAHAAREAVRAAAVDPDPDAARRAAEQAGPLDPDRLEVEVTGRGEVGSRVRARVRYTAGTRLPLVGRALYGVVLTGTSTMRVERCAEPPHTAATMAVSRAARRRASAPSLSSGSLPLPHFGDCTHDGHPAAQPQAATSSAVARTWRSAASNPSSATPAPPW